MAARLLVMVAMFVSFPLSASTTSPANDPRPAAGLFGTGFELIDWTGAERVDGFRYLIGFREGRGTLPILIHNTSKQPMVNARMRVTWTDPENSDNKSADEAAWVYPAVIEPGEFGFIGAKPEIGSFPKEGGVIRVFRLTGTTPEMESRRVLDVAKPTVDSSGWFTGEVQNRSGDPVEEMSLRWVCVERSGLVIQYDLHAIDSIRRLNDGDGEAIRLRVGPECEDGLIITAQGHAT